MITAIGNPVYDYIKTQKIETEGRVLSGCSTNAVLALARLGRETCLIGAVGDDFKEDFIKKLNDSNIDFWIYPSEESGGFSLIYYDDFGNRTLDLIGRAANLDGINPRFYRDSDAVLVAPILGEISFEEIKNIRKNFNGFFFCDPQGLLRAASSDNRIIHEKIDGIEQALSVFNVVKPNEMEAKVLTGVDCRKDPYKAAEIIKGWGPQIVIVTLAELGSVIYDGKEFIDIPAYGVDLIDATGAGDTYMGGFTHEYLKTKDLKKAGCFGSAVASIMIEQVGPDFKMTEEEVRKRQESLLAVADFKIKLDG